MFRKIVGVSLEKDAVGYLSLNQRDGSCKLRDHVTPIFFHFASYRNSILLSTVVVRFFPLRNSYCKIFPVTERKTLNPNPHYARREICQVSVFFFLYLCEYAYFALSRSCRAASLTVQLLFNWEVLSPKAVAIASIADLTCDIRWRNKGTQVHFSESSFSIHKCVPLWMTYNDTLLLPISIGKSMALY